MYDISLYGSSHLSKYLLLLFKHQQHGLEFPGVHPAQWMQWTFWVWAGRTVHAVG